MDKYIQQLIVDNTRVIIPDFGAFIRPQGEGEIMFNQFLSFDDGMLVGAVKDAENVSEEEAKAKIASYVEQLRTKLDAGESVSISGIGSFMKEGEHISMKLEEKSPIIDIPNQPTEQPKAEQPAPMPAAAPKEENKDPEKKTEYTTVYTSNDPEEKKKTWIMILIIVLLFLAGVYICLFVVNKDNAVYNYFFGTEQVDEVEPAPVVVKPEPKVETPAPEPVVSQPLEKRYNIIVGSYNDEASANTRISNLHAKGFDKSFVIKRDINGKTKFLAVIESHDRLPEAERRQEEIVDNYRIESWITNAGE